MGEMVKKIFTSFTDVITNLSTGLKSAFTNIVYEDPTATEKVLSAPVEFVLITVGISLAVGLVYGAFRLIRARV